MVHQMRLFDRPFELIRKGLKIYEIRLNDEKRQKVQIGDIIEFRRLYSPEDMIRVKVLGINPYESFEKLYEDIPAGDFGCEGMSMEELLESTYEIYSKEDELQWGALAIKVRII